MHTNKALKSEISASPGLMGLLPEASFFQLQEFLELSPMYVKSAHFAVAWERPPRHSLLLLACIAVCIGVSL